MCEALCTNATRADDACAWACAQIDHALDASVLSPADLPTSEIDAHLAFRTRIGTYLFCVAVVLSLSCSVFVDSLEDKLLPDDDEARDDGNGHTEGARGAALSHRLVGGGAINSVVADDSSRAVRLLQPTGFPSNGTSRLKLERACHTAAVLVQLLLTYCAVTMPIFHRVVVGGIPMALKARGFDFDGAFSLVDLARLAAGPGGWDYLLSGTFWAFIIICPLLRGITQLIVLVMPLSRANARCVHRVSRAISYYYAHEVMLVGVPLLQITIGPLTSTLFTPRVTPACGTFDKLYNQPSCFQIKIVPGTGYVATCVAVGVFLLTGFDGSPTHKWMHRQLFPADTRPPPQCCRGT